MMLVTKLLRLTVCVVGLAELSVAFQQLSSMRIKSSRPKIKKSSFDSSSSRSRFEFNNYYLPSSRTLLLQESNAGKDEDIIENDDSKDKIKVKKSLVSRFDDFGQSLKPKALDAKSQASSLSSISIDDENEKNNSKDKYIYAMKACMYYTLFIMYRAYRGFFVILPAVFKEVYKKMKDAVDSPFLVDEYTKDNPKTDNSPTPWRTRITVSALAGIVTVTYVLGGLWRIVSKFAQNIIKTKSILGSFEEAANEVEVNEDRISRIGTNIARIDDKDLNGKSSSSSSSNSSSKPKSPPSSSNSSGDGGKLAP